MSPRQLIDFNINEEKGIVTFTMDDKQTFEIPSELFPLREGKRKGVFMNANTVPYENEQFYKLIDQLPLPVGACYRNADAIQQVGDFLKINIKFYSGWVFKGPSYPVHHAWSVIQWGDGQVSVIDSLKTKLFDIIDERVRHIKDIDEQRMASVEMFGKLLKKYPKNSQQMITGQVSPSLIYVGSEDTANYARKTYNKLIEKFPDHPTYVAEGRNPHGRSKSQQLMKDAGLDVL